MDRMNPDHDNIRDIYMRDDPTMKAKQGEKAIPKLLGSLGAIAFALGFIIMALSNKVNVYNLGLSGVGLLLLIIFIALDFKQVKKVLTSRSTIYSTNLTIVILALLGILVIVNSVSANHYVAIDLTSNRDNTLSAQTRQVLDEVNTANREVELTVFMRKDDERRLYVKTLLDQYRHFAPALAYVFIDYEISKKLAVEKGVDRPSVLLESAGASEFIFNFDERSLTGGFLKLLHPDQKVVGLLIGHGEYGPSSTGGKSITELIDLLEKENYLVKSIDITTGGAIPDEVSTVVIIAPQKPINEQEVAILKDYANRGGSIALFIEPFSDHGLDTFLENFGVADLKDMVIDPTENYFQDITIPVIKVYTHHPITENFLSKQLAEGSYAGGLVVPTATGLKIAENQSMDLNLVPLALTSEDSWGETSSENTELTPDEDNKGPVVVAVAGTKKYHSEEEKTQDDFNFIVVGDADFLTDANIKNGSNFDFALNSVIWLTQKVEEIADRPELAMKREIVLEAPQAKAVQIVNVFIPLLIAGLGLIMWLKRR